MVRIICQATRLHIPDGRNFQRNRVRTSNLASGTVSCTLIIELFLQKTDVHGTRMYGVTLKALPWMAHISCVLIFPPNQVHVVCKIEQFSVLVTFGVRLFYRPVRELD